MSLLIELKMKSPRKNRGWAEGQFKPRPDEVVEWARMGSTQQRRFLVLLAVLAFQACTPTSSDEQPQTPQSVTQSESSGSSVTGGSSERLVGSGNVQVEGRSVTGFDRISFTGAAVLLIEQAGEESLTIEAEDNLLPVLTSEVSGGRLVLGLKPNTNITFTSPIIYRLKVRSLSEIEASGSGRVEGSGIDTPELTVTSSGSMKVELTGRADRQVIEVSGTGHFDGGQLGGRRVSVEASGTGRSTVNAAETLDVEVGGTAVVSYRGEPAVSQRVSGLGRVEKA